MAGAAACEPGRGLGAIAGALLMIARLPEEGSTQSIAPKTDPESDLRL